MAKIDLARRAKIGRDRRERTRAKILKAGGTLLAEGAALTIDAVAEVAGLAKGKSPGGDAPLCRTLSSALPLTESRHPK